MENKKSNNRKLFKIITIILFILLILWSIIIAFIYSKKTELTKEYKDLNKNYEKILSIKEEIEEKYSNIKNDTDKINNIDNEIIEEKKIYFQNIKKLEDKILNGESNKKIAYLTFDDGPYNLTYEYLDILDKYDVKGTFFTIGLGKERCLDKKDKSCYPLYQEIVKRGHTIANHTYSHSIFGGLYSSSESFITQVKKQEELIKNETGVITNIVRFPGGSVTAKGKKESIIEKLKENNYGWVDWSAQDGDGGNLTSKEQALNIFKNSIDENIEVVLLHDYNYITLSILPEIIEYLQQNGYILLPLFYESNMVNK